MRKKKVYIDTFDQEVHLYKINSKKDFKKLKEKYSLEDKEFHSFAGFTFSGYFETNKKVYTVVAIKSLDNCLGLIKTIIHECSHATFDILDYIGVGLANESQEVYCYLLDYLCGEAFKFYKIV